MVILLQVSQQVLPDQSSELILSRSGRAVSSLLTCPLALCTVALHAQVGQEGISEADQMQVYNCRPIGAILVLAEPQQLLGVFQPLLNFPAPVVHLDEPSGRQLRVVGDQAEDLLDGAFAGEDHVECAQVTDLQPASTQRKRTRP
jgi:hypothetical protein